MSEMLERVARALYPKIAWAYKWDGNTPYDALNEHAKEVLAQAAQAVIAAMREPTEAMLAAGGSGAFGEITSPIAEHIWQTMIDKALR